MKDINVNGHINFFVRKFKSKNDKDICALYVQIGEVQKLICFLKYDYDYENIK